MMIRGSRDVVPWWLAGVARSAVPGLLALALAAPVLAADNAGMTIAQLMKLRTVSEVATSPDGARVAYVLRVPRDPFREDNGSAWTELHVVEANDVSRPFVTGAVKVQKVAWTPDGRAISFLARHDGKVPPDWSVLDSIGSNDIDLGRWNHSGQALLRLPHGQ